MSLTLTEDLKWSLEQSNALQVSFSTASNWFVTLNCTLSKYGRQGSIFFYTLYLWSRWLRVKILIDTFTWWIGIHSLKWSLLISIKNFNLFNLLKGNCRRVKTFFDNLCLKYFVQTMSVISVTDLWSSIRIYKKKENRNTAPIFRHVPVKTIITRLDSAQNLSKIPKKIRILENGTFIQRHLGHAIELV